VSRQLSPPGVLDGETQRVSVGGDYIRDKRRSAARPGMRDVFKQPCGRCPGDGAIIFGDLIGKLDVLRIE
jgi:hypothetical protein